MLEFVYALIGFLVAAWHLWRRLKVVWPVG
jgi:hypothetical protein